MGIVHSGNLPYFFTEFMLTLSNLSGVQTFFIKLFGPINMLQEASINTVTNWQNDLNLIVIFQVIEVVQSL